MRMQMIPKAHGVGSTSNKGLDYHKYLDPPTQKMPILYH